MKPVDLPFNQLPDNAGPTDPLAGLPGLDARVGRASTDGKELFYRRLLRMFRVGQRDAAAQFRAARARGDMGSAVRVAHNLRSVAASLGMLELARVGRALEIAARDGVDDAGLAPLIDAVEHGLAVVLRGLDGVEL